MKMTTAELEAMVKSEKICRFCFDPSTDIFTTNLGVELYVCHPHQIALLNSLEYHKASRSYTLEKQKAYGRKNTQSIK